MKWLIRPALLLFLYIPLLRAQNSIGSLENQLKTAASQKDSIGILSQFIYEYSFENPKSALTYAENAIGLIEKAPDSIYMADLYNSIGVAYHFNGNYLVSIEYFLKALEGFEKSNDSLKIANILNNIGITYTELGNYEKSESFFQESMSIHRKLGKPDKIAALLNNIGNNHENKGNIDSADLYYTNSLKIAEEHDLPFRKADALLNLGSIQYKRHNFFEALEYLKKALELDLQNNNLSGLVETYGLLGEIYLDLNNYELSYEYLEKALNLSQRLKMKNRESEIYKILSRYYARKGNFRAAFDNHVKFTNLKDSIFSLKSERQIEDLQLSYENDKREQEIALLSERANLQATQLKLQKTKTRLLLVFTILSIFILGLLLVSIRIKNKANKLLKIQYDKIQQQNKELEKRSNKLIDLSEEKDSFINVVAHDLKSPLNNIIGLANLIKINGNLNEEQYHYLNMLDQVTLEAKNLISNLLDINKLESGNIEETFEKFEMSEVVEKEINYFRKDAQEKNIILEKLCTGEGIIENNKEFIQRILTNLISNAIKFSPEHTKITVSCTYHQNKMILSVKDQGPGISEEEQKNLFKKFQKLSSRPTGGESSTGLGLAIVKLMVDKLKGKIEVRSKLKEGTEFIITFPAVVYEKQ